MSFGKHSTLKEILDHPRAREVLLRHVPGAEKHPQLSYALSMTLSEVATYPEAGISREKLDALVADLQSLK